MSVVAALGVLGCKAAQFRDLADSANEFTALHCVSLGELQKQVHWG